MLRNPPPPASSSLKGWKPVRLPDGSRDSLYAGHNAKSLPRELAGLTVTVRARSGQSWDATIFEVVKHTPERILVRARRLEQ